MRFHSTMRIHLLAILLAPGVVQCTQAEVHRFPAVVDESFAGFLEFLGGVVAQVAGLV